MKLISKETSTMHLTNLIEGFDHPHLLPSLLETYQGPILQIIHNLLTHA